MKHDTCEQPASGRTGGYVGLRVELQEDQE